MSYIEIKNVTKKIKRNIVLNNINLSIEKGNIVGICGPNGSGKTMLLRAMSGLIKIDSGTIMVNENPLVFSEAYPIRIGIVIESSDLVSNLTGQEMLYYLYGIDNKTVDEEIIEYYMKKFDIYDYRNIKTAKYSLGMKKKIEIIQAIMEEQELILLDEPTNALDEDSIIALKEVLLDLRENGKTIVIATHQSELINEIADKIVRIYKGEITENRK